MKPALLVAALIAASACGSFEDEDIVRTLRRDARYRERREERGAR